MFEQAHPFDEAFSGQSVISALELRTAASMAMRRTTFAQTNEQDDYRIELATVRDLAHRRTHRPASTEREHGMWSLRYPRFCSTRSLFKDTTERSSTQTQGPHP